VSTTDVLGIVAASFGVFMGSSPLLQAIRVHRRRHSADVSLPFLLVLFAGGCAWLAYGIALGSVPLIVPNTVGVLASGTSCLVVLRWRRTEAPVTAGSA
jgi:MtN3 and saliva related transmembrane protein